MLINRIQNITRRTSSMTALLGAILLASLAGMGAHAGEIMNANTEAYKQAVAAKKPILMHVHANWCPVCSKQNPIIEELMKEPEFKDVVVFKIDFDANKDLVNMLEVKYQSTLIAAKGQQEVARSAGLTDKEQVRAFIRKAL